MRINLSIPKTKIYFIYLGLKKTLFSVPHRRWRKPAFSGSFPLYGISCELKYLGGYRRSHNSRSILRQRKQVNEGDLVGIELSLLFNLHMNANGLSRGLDTKMTLYNALTLCDRALLGIRSWLWWSVKTWTWGHEKDCSATLLLQLAVCF